MNKSKDQGSNRRVLKPVDKGSTTRISKYEGKYYATTRLNVPSERRTARETGARAVSAANRGNAAIKRTVKKTNASDVSRAKTANNRNAKKRVPRKMTADGLARNKLAKFWARANEK